MLWEFNRHQYLIPSAQCWLIDDDRDDFELVQRHLASWLSENPPRMGVNWASSLEVSYRAICWCWLLWLLADAPWDNEIRRALIDSLEVHALHIERYLSTYFSPNTHLTGEALGLFYVGTVVPESPHAGRWRERGAEILESCVTWHVHSDGVYFEQASHYQRYTAEIYLHFSRLSQSTARPVPLSVSSALVATMNVLRTIVDGAGVLPAIGDDDGGALVPFDCEDPAQLAGLLLASATHLNRPDWLIRGANCRSMAYWLCGAAAAEEMLSRASHVPRWSDVHFRAGGIAVLRDSWSPDADVAVLDCGPHGAMNCGHAHADALSIVLHVGRTPLLVDRGTLTYVGSERNAYRATASHNTMEFDDTSSVAPAGPFQWRMIPPRADAEVWRAGEFAVFDGIAFGHPGTGNPSIHRRVVIHIRDGTWVVYDRGWRNQCARATTHWQIGPALTVTTIAAREFEIREPSGGFISSVVFPLSPVVLQANEKMSPRFGATINASKLSAQADSDLRCLTIISTIEAGLPPQHSDLMVSPGNRGHAWSVGRRQHMALAPADEAGVVDMFGLRAKGELILFSADIGSEERNTFEPDAAVIINVGPGPVPVPRDDQADRTPTIRIERRAQSGWQTDTMSVVSGIRD